MRLDLILSVKDEYFILLYKMRSFLRFCIIFVVYFKTSNESNGVHRIVSLINAFRRIYFNASKMYIAHLLNKVLYLSFARTFKTHFVHIVEIKVFDNHQWKQNTCTCVR